MKDNRFLLVGWQIVQCKKAMSEDLPENGDEFEHVGTAKRIVLPESHKIELDSGNYAVQSGGIIRCYLKDDRELFSVDSNSFPFERKILGVVMQIYLLGYQSARANERQTCKQRVLAAINLLFE